MIWSTVYVIAYVVLVSTVFNTRRALLCARIHQFVVNGQAEPVNTKSLQHCKWTSCLGRPSFSTGGSANGGAEYIYAATNSSKNTEICRFAFGRYPPCPKPTIFQWNSSYPSCSAAINPLSIFKDWVGAASTHHSTKTNHAFWLWSWSSIVYKEEERLHGWGIVICKPVLEPNLWTERLPFRMSLL